MTFKIPGVKLRFQTLYGYQIARRLLWGGNGEQYHNMRIHAVSGIHSQLKIMRLTLRNYRDRLLFPYR